MWNKPTPKNLANLPELYSEDGKPLGEKVIHMHFFIGGCDWYVAEFDGEDIFFGYAILNGDFTNAEWGTFSLSELDSIRVGPFEIDNDKFWKVRPAAEVENIVNSGGIL